MANSLTTPVKTRARVTSKQVVIQVLSETPLDYYIELETIAGYSIAHGTTFVYKKASEGYTNDQVLIEGVDGCHITLQRVKYNKETGSEISRSSEHVEVRPLHTTIVKTSG